MRLSEELATVERRIAQLDELLSPMIDAEADMGLEHHQDPKSAAAKV